MITMKKFKLEELLPAIEEAFSKNEEFTLPITGTSMLPLLVQGRDLVRIKKAPESLEIGDIPLYRRNNGMFVLHRVVEISENTYTMCGDNQIDLEKGITQRHIIGVVSALVIDGREIDVSADAEYLKYKNKYIKNLKTRYPKRRIAKFINGFSGK